MKIDPSRLAVRTDPPAFSLNDLFASPAGNSGSTELPVEKLIPFDGQPFKPYTEERLRELAEDIKLNGVLSPIIVRPVGEAYQILAGHNRTAAAKLAGLDRVPAIIRDVDDNTAALIVCTTNLNQRQELLPSEKAFAYKMQMEALKGATNCRTSSIVAESNDENKRQIQRYIRLTCLIPDLLEEVDSNRLPMMAGVNLSYLAQAVQERIHLFFFTTKHGKINLKTAAKLREQLSGMQDVTAERLMELIKRPEKEKATPSPAAATQTNKDEGDDQPKQSPSISAQFFSLGMEMTELLESGGQEELAGVLGRKLENIWNLLIRAGYANV